MSLLVTLCVMVLCSASKTIECDLGMVSMGAMVHCRTAKHFPTQRSAELIDNVFNFIDSSGDDSHCQYPAISYQYNKKNLITQLLITPSINNDATPPISIYCNHENRVNHTKNGTLLSNFKWCVKDYDLSQKVVLKSGSTLTTRLHGGSYVIISCKRVSNDTVNRRQLQGGNGDEGFSWEAQAVGAGASTACVGVSIALTGGTAAAFGAWACPSLGFLASVIWDSIDWGNPKNDNAWLTVTASSDDKADGNALGIAYHRYNGDVDRDSLGDIGRGETKTWEEDLDASWLKHVELYIHDWDDICVRNFQFIIGKEPSTTGRRESIEISAPVVSYCTEGRGIMHNDCVYFGDTATGAVGNFKFWWQPALQCWRLYGGYNSQMDYAQCMKYTMVSYDILKPGGGYTRYTYTSNTVNLPGWLSTPMKQLKNRISGDHACADLHQSVTDNGQKVHLWNCGGDTNEFWDRDSEGRIRSKVNPNKCLEAGRSGNLYDKVYVWDCHDGMHQRWTFYTSGRIKNQAFDKYLGVAYCGQNEDKQLELRNYESSGDCGTSQQWDWI